MKQASHHFAYYLRRSTVVPWFCGKEQVSFIKVAQVIPFCSVATRVCIAFNISIHTTFNIQRIVIIQGVDDTLGLIIYAKWRFTEWNSSFFLQSTKHIRGCEKNVNMLRCKTLILLDLLDNLFRIISNNIYISNILLWLSW